jgi:hypothetical protein
MHHKYLVDIDGESWSSRFFQLLASGATVFKQVRSPELIAWSHMRI